MPARALAAILVVLAAPLAWPTGARAPHAALVTGVAVQLRRHYVDPAIGDAMARAIERRQAEGAYAAVAPGEAIARRLTADLFAIARDRHVVVATAGADPSADGTPPGFARIDYGSRAVEVLPGNIGYYRVDLLAAPRFSRSRHAAAMRRLAGTDALVLDFRNNHGAMGEGSVEELASYFFARPTHLADRVWRDPARGIERSVTHGAIDGPRYLGRPVYVLTSPATFSGAEGFASQLQELGRVRVVGERSGGAANPGQPRQASAGYTVWVPNGRVRNARSGGNWEGLGVAPDLPAAAPEALLVAHRDALDGLLARPATAGARRSMLARVRADVARRLAAFRPVRFTLEGHAEALVAGVAGDFNGQDPLALPLRREGGHWVAATRLPPGRHRYRYVVDGRAIPDPGAEDTDAGGWSLRVVDPVTRPRRRRGTRPRRRRSPSWSSAARGDRVPCRPARAPSPR